MCGISAILGRVREPGILIEKMSSAISHRGPDAAGKWISDGVALGHQRLAVIDLSPLGLQPMCGSREDIVVTYNGEIYNFKELRAELESRGHRFRSASDTEVIVRLYEEFGDACVARLNGMFAFVLWDGPRRRALVACDRFGQKPIYLAEHAGVHYIASEIKALLAAVPIARDIDPRAIDTFLTCNAVAAPTTFYRSIRRLDAGELLVYEDRGDAPGRVTTRRYVPPRPSRSAASYEEALERTSAALDAAVRRQLVSDVPVGLFLSGGIDSTLVLSRVAQNLPPGFRAFTATFDASERDELPFARAVAKRFGATLETVHVSAEDYRDPEAVVAMFDEPFADVAAIPLAKLCRAARRAFTVALTGDGGDELFGGYETHVAARWEEALGPPGRIRRAVAGLGAHAPEVSRLPTSVRRAVKLFAFAADDWRASTIRLRENLRPEERSALFRPDVLRTLDGHDPWRTLLPRTTGDVESLFDPVDDRTLGPFNHKSDIAAMASSLECRSPFLDLELLDVARSLPRSHLVRALQGKRVLRSLVARDVDANISRRRKTGFSPPLEDWLRDDLAFLLDTYLLEATELPGWVEPREVARRVAEHRSGRANHRRVLWGLILLEIWLRRERRAVTARAA